MSRVPRVPFNFLTLPGELSSLHQSRVAVLPVPYDSTTSFRGGARHGPQAILEASYALEDFDHEFMDEVSRLGIYTADAVEPHMDGPAHMVARVQQAVAELVAQGKLVVTLGGEHSISTGAVEAFLSTHPDLSVLFLDAHADFRDQYMDSPWSHACVARRIQQRCPIVLAGTRSLSAEEWHSLQELQVPVFFWRPYLDFQAQIREVISHLSQHVYVSIDLDVLDPSLMAAVGTPEPGGLDWSQITSLLRCVGQQRQVVGFDVVELSPTEGPVSCAYVAARLAYKMMGYALVPPADYPGSLANMKG